ncbi:aldose 1-epimerase, partial [Sarracenia purpurea var. burkii]
RYKYISALMAKTALLCGYILLVLCFGGNGRAEQEIGVYELKRGDFSVKLTNWGATVLSVILPDKNGTFPILLHLFRLLACFLSFFLSSTLVFSMLFNIP